MRSAARRCGHFPCSHPDHLLFGVRMFSCSSVLLEFPAEYTKACHETTFPSATKPPFPSPRNHLFHRHCPPYRLFCISAQATSQRQRSIALPHRCPRRSSMDRLAWQMWNHPLRFFRIEPPVSDIRPLAPFVRSRVLPRSEADLQEVLDTLSRNIGPRLAQCYMPSAPADIPTDEEDVEVYGPFYILDPQSALMEHPPPVHEVLERSLGTRSRSDRQPTAPSGFAGRHLSGTAVRHPVAVRAPLAAPVPPRRPAPEAEAANAPNAPNVDQHPSGLPGASFGLSRSNAILGGEDPGDDDSMTTGSLFREDAVLAQLLKVSRFFDVAGCFAGVAVLEEGSAVWVCSDCSCFSRSFSKTDSHPHSEMRHLQSIPAA